MTASNTRMKFGVFMAPFHRVGENPTLALERDLELLQWLDTLGCDVDADLRHTGVDWPAGNGAQSSPADHLRAILGN